MIDFLTLHLPELMLSDDLRAVLMSWGHRVRRYDAATGEVDWDTSAWESIRSVGEGVLKGKPTKILGR